MDFSDHVVFAALMTLYSELEKEETTVSNTEPASARYDPVPPSRRTNANRDPSSGVQRLCALAQKIFDDANHASGMPSDTRAEDLIPPTIIGLLVESISSMNVSQDTKIQIYNFACTYCFGQCEIPGEMLFNPAMSELSSKIAELTDITIAAVFSAAQSADHISSSTDFTCVLAEYLQQLEAVICEHYPNIDFIQRPALIAVSKSLDCAKNALQKMEAEHPDLLQQSCTSTPKRTKQNQHLIQDLLETARRQQKSGNKHAAQKCYQQILELQPDNWEAYFRKTYCAVYDEQYFVNPEMISTNTNRMVQCVKQAAPLAKEQLFTRIDLLNAAAEIATGTTGLASNYFCAAMDVYKRSSKSAAENTAKIKRVNAIIHMLFKVGDYLHASFQDDSDICYATACACWKVAFECYENCNMPVPPGAESHYQKILKYDPAFRCSKPVREVQNAPSQRTGSTASTDSGGCYIATCVYGSYDCPQVWTLRRFRDKVLAQNGAGRYFIRFYYTVSPHIVRYFGQISWIRKIWKSGLDRLVLHLSNKGFQDSPYDDIV